MVSVLKVEGGALGPRLISDRRWPGIAVSSSRIPSRPAP